MYDRPGRTFDRPRTGGRTRSNPAKCRVLALAHAVLYRSGMSTFNKIVRRHRNSGRLDTLFISMVAFVTTAVIQLAV